MIIKLYDIIITAAMNAIILNVRPLKQTKHNGERVYFICTAEGIVFWTLASGGKLPRNARTSKKSDANKNWLMINNIQHWNSNFYTCWTEKDFLLVYATAQLIVVSEFRYLFNIGGYGVYHRNTINVCTERS